MTKTVNHWGVWVSSDTPITGVESNNRIFWLGEELNNGIDLAYEEHILECDQCQKDETCEIVENWEYSEDILIGDWIKDSDGLGIMTLKVNTRQFVGRYILRLFIVNTLENVHCAALATLDRVILEA